MTRQVFIKLSQMFLLGGRRRFRLVAGGSQTEPNPAFDVSSLHLPDDNPWIFVTQRAQEANLLTKLHSADQKYHRLMQHDSDARRRWHPHGTEQLYSPETVEFDPQLELYYEQLGLGKGEEAPRLEF